MNSPGDGWTAQQAPAPAGPFRRVLVGWDGSVDSVAALRLAAVAESAIRSRKIPVLLVSATSA